MTWSLTAWTGTARTDVAGDPSAAQPRRQEVAVEQARAAPVERRLGGAGVDEGGHRRRDVRRPGRGDLDHEPGRAEVAAWRECPAAGEEELGSPSIRAVELHAQPVTRHQALGRIIGRGDFLEAKA